MNISRRSALALTGAALEPAVALLRGRLVVPGARAAGAAPRRLLFVYLPNSPIRAAWAPTGGRDALTGQGDARQFTLGRQIAPLDLVREHATFIEGLSGVPGGKDFHVTPVHQLMTGHPPIDSMSHGIARAASIDQILLGRSPLLKGAPVASLQMMADTRVPKDRMDLRALSYVGSAQPLPPEMNPSVVYGRLFSSSATPVAMGPGAVPTQDLARLRARRKSVIDFVKEDARRLGQRLPRAESERLGSHLQAIRDLEIGLDRLAATPGAPPPMPPAIAGLGPTTDVRTIDSSTHRAVVDQHLALIRTAFQLDLTRVVTFGYSPANSFIVFSRVLGAAFPSEGVHSVTHGGGTTEHLVGIHRWYSEITAGFVASLAAIKESDGSSLLDNTLVVLFSECSEGHDRRNLPIVLFGGSRLGVAGGRLLRFAGRNVHDLAPTIAKAFGVDIGSFGESGAFRGVLPEVVS